MSVAPTVLTPAWDTLRPHSQQGRLWRTKARFVAVAAGRGSGKTELARRRIVRYLPVKKPWVNPLYFYALPTYRQARRVAWKPIISLIPKHWIKGQPNETDLRIETIFGSTLYVVGMDKPQRIEGDQWDGGVVDESCDQRPDSFGRSILPALSHRYGWCWRIGVPKRVGCGAIEFKEFFYKGIEAARKAAEEGVQSEHESYTWPSEDILTEDQLHWARENLDPIDYNEQYRASWESCGGMIFHQFHETMNIRDDICYDPNKPLIIGSDFNVSPMAWVVCQTHEELGIKYLYVLDELFIHNTNTQATLDKLFYSYGRSHNGGFYFFGDATSRARNTRASESDYVQIRNDMRFKGARVFYPKHNPNRANRFAACNAQFCNTLGIRRCFVHKRCKNLIRDLLLRAYKEGTTEPDDYGDVGHITDALGYVIYTIFPLHVEQDIRAEIYVG